MRVVHHAMTVCCAAALSAALGTPLSAQVSVSTATFTERSAFISAGRNTPISLNDLNALPSGSSVVPFLGAFGNGTVVGASIANGRIEASGPFSILLSYGRLEGFGADFLTDGEDVVSMTFFRGGVGTTITRSISAGDPQFLGFRLNNMWTSPDLLTRVDISVQSGTPYRVDNLIVAAPEPSTWALLGTGLLALGGVAVRRKRAV